MYRTFERQGSTSKQLLLPKGFPVKAVKRCVRKVVGWHVAHTRDMPKAGLASGIGELENDTV